MPRPEEVVSNQCRLFINFLGALLDMGCYLIQFATLAHQSVLTYKDYLRSLASTTPAHSSSNSESTDYYDNSILQNKYPYDYTSMFPDEIQANGLVGSDGIDVETAFLLRVRMLFFCFV